MKKLVFLCVLLICYACGDSYVNKNKVYLVDLPAVYNYKGRVKDYKIDRTKPFVANYYNIGNFKWALRSVPLGQIDKLIKKYKDFTFVFYIDRLNPEDTLKVMNILNEYNCKFSVILDFQNEYYQKNKGNLNPFNQGWLTSVGYVCDKKSRIRGIALAGVKRFELDFLKIRSEIYSRKGFFF